VLAPPFADHHVINFFSYNGLIATNSGSNFFFFSHPLERSERATARPRATAKDPRRQQGDNKATTRQQQGPSNKPKKQAQATSKPKTTTRHDGRAALLGSFFGRFLRLALLL
jgi:hypothetical protein